MFKTIRDFDVANKRVLVRADFNVPLSEEGEILDDFRIRAALLTIKYLAEKEAKIILMSHLGRPEGRIVEGLRLAPIQKRIGEFLNIPVFMAPDCIGPKTEELIREMKSGEIILLENLRFHPEEEAADENFAKELAKLGDIYINDAFGASHRAHASVSGITKFLPAGAGFLMEKEVKILSGIIENPQRPLVAVIGGKKAETKAGVINKISEIGDWVLIGGLIRKEIKEKNISLKFPEKIIEPVDGLEGKDIGPKTIEIFKEKISQAKTIFWSGPLGQIEEERFSQGSEEIAKLIIESKAFSVAGGGETVAFINRLGLIERFNHVSTGGGAMLEFLSGKSLPGLQALEQQID
jgi:phosphoglycerate kinase